VLGAALFGAMAAWLVALAAHVEFRRRAGKIAVSSLAGFAAIVLSLVATWWYSRVTVISGVGYLVALSGAYLLVRRKPAGGQLTN
jgi:hypothetical protein